MRALRANDGVLHLVWTSTTLEYMSYCGVFYEKYKLTNGVATCLRCIGSVSKLGWVEETPFVGGDFNG